MGGCHFLLFLNYQNLPIYHKFKNKPIFPFFKFFDILADSDNSKIAKNGNPIRKKAIFFFFFFSYFSVVFFLFFSLMKPRPLYITILRRQYATTSFPNIRVFDAIVGLMADRSHRSGAEMAKVGHQPWRSNYSRQK